MEETNVIVFAIVFVWLATVAFLAKIYLETKDNNWYKIKKKEKAMHTAISTPLRSNYSFQQIQQQEWNHDDKFESLKVVTPSMRQWWAWLKINGKTIALESVDQDVLVDGVKLSFAQMLNLRDYIRKTYFPRPATPVYSIFQPAL